MPSPVPVEEIVDQLLSRSFSLGLAPHLPVEI
jgi:hypothetical protein